MEVFAERVSNRKDGGDQWDELTQDGGSQQGIVGERRLDWDAGQSLKVIGGNQCYDLALCAQTRYRKVMMENGG